MLFFWYGAIPGIILSFIIVFIINIKSGFIYFISTIFLIIWFPISLFVWFFLEFIHSNISMLFEKVIFGLFYGIMIILITSIGLGGSLGMIIGIIIGLIRREKLPKAPDSTEGLGTYLFGLLIPIIILTGLLRFYLPIMKEMSHFILILFEKVGMVP